MKVCILGLGFVGSAMEQSFNVKNCYNKYDIHGYDKYKNINTFDVCLDAQIIFLSLPTLYNSSLKSYEYDSIYETCYLLEKNDYKGVIVIKSTVEPTLIEQLAQKYKSLDFIHNPEFLTAKTAYEDFHNQKHIVLGKHHRCSDQKFSMVFDFYKNLYSDAEISVCTSTESESIKIFCNTFYAIKIQYFNELYLLCQKINVNYDNIVRIMLKNGWINPMHTQVPGTDGNLSYGGLCFPKDTNALLEFMKKNDSPHAVLEATINERNNMRDDHDNIKKE